jgi:hypothetical protein
MINRRSIALQHVGIAETRVDIAAVPNVHRGLLQVCLHGQFRDTTSVVESVGDCSARPVLRPSVQSQQRHGRYAVILVAGTNV